MLDDQILELKVWGRFACFTRPELKVERMSYPMMTPSAARGVLDAILFKKVTDERTGRLVPAFHWHVRRITALKPWWLPQHPEPPPYQFVSIRRNEIQDKISPKTVKKWMKDAADFMPYRVDSAGRDSPDGDHRSQRNTLALRDVAYLIEASLDMSSHSAADPPAKYREMFERRLRKGQCFHRPYLGCREFACNFAAPDGNEQAVDWNEDFGLILYDLRFDSDGENVPGFFQAGVRGGVLHCDTVDPAPWGDPPVKVFGWSEAESRTQEVH